MLTRMRLRDAMCYRLLREPLVHFAVLGGLVLGAGVLFEDAPGVDRSIRVPVEALEAEFEKMQGRAPTQTERAGMVKRWVEEEALYREALARGLDRGDAVIRGRLVERMRFLTASVQPREEVGDAALEAALRADPERWAIPARTTFEHVFVSGSGQAVDAADVAARTLEALRGGADPGTLGDPFGLPSRVVKRGDAWVATRLGDEFAQALPGLPEGEWAGPVSSSYGLHLVRVEERTEGRPARLDDVRERLRRDVVREQRLRAQQRAVDEVVARFRVEVPAP